MVLKPMRAEILSRTHQIQVENSKLPPQHSKMNDHQSLEVNQFTNQSLDLLLFEIIGIGQQLRIIS